MSNTRTQIDGASDPHARQPVLAVGPAPEKAAATLILVHGRGATAESMLGFLPELGAEDVAAIAPQAAGNTWYPYSFLEPMEKNQPYLDSALLKLDTIVSELLARGVRSERIAFLGFSQGACLSAEFVARHPRRYGAVMVLSGGLIGPPGTPRDYSGSLEKTPAFLGCSDPDPHIPFERVRESAETLTRMGALVDLRRYPNMGHTVNEDEIEACRALLRQIVENRGI